jgi:hypothetical protein
MNAVKLVNDTSLPRDRMSRLKLQETYILCKYFACSSCGTACHSGESFIRMMPSSWTAGGLGESPDESELRDVHGEVGTSRRDPMSCSTIEASDSSSPVRFLNDWRSGNSPTASCSCVWTSQQYLARGSKFSSFFCSLVEVTT